MAIGWIDRESKWKDRARALQLQLRERFRVAVDRRRRSTEVPDYSAKFHRWIIRVQSLWSDSSAAARPPIRFYRKRVGKDVEGIDDSTIIRFVQSLAVPVIGSACHVFMHGFNRVQVYGAEKLHQALLQRPQGKSLITVSNHVAAVDDPFVTASLLPPSTMLDARNLRWTLCATDRCFKNAVLSAFFRCVKVLPVSRGDGVYQKGMDMALSKLNNGGWVHIFPEGSRSRDGGRTLGFVKRGVGRLIMDADSVPLVIPIVHTGMQDIMPVGTHFPKIGKEVTVIVGDPIYLDDLVVIGKEDTQDVSRGILYDAVASRIGHRLQELKAKVDILALEHSVKVQDYPCERNFEHGYRIWQHADWEAFGMENLILTEETSHYAEVITGQQKQTLDLHKKKMESTAYSSVSVRVGFSYEGGIVSRVRGYMNPPEFMGFAARGLFMQGRVMEEKHRSIQEVNPFKAWRQFLGENMLHRWNNV